MKGPTCFVAGTKVLTETHPFYVADRGWVRAKDLKAGTILVTETGQYVKVDLVLVEECEAPVTVYNLEIEDFHTYFVGGQNVWVHNTCGGSGKNPPSKCNISKKKFGKKWGKHKDDYPDLSMDEYKNLIDDVFQRPDKVIQDVKNNEFLYLKGKNLLRVKNNGEFISLYPGAKSSRVLSAIEKGGIIWQK